MVSISYLTLSLVKQTFTTELLSDVNLTEVLRAVEECNFPGALQKTYPACHCFSSTLITVNSQAITLIVFKLYLHSKLLK